MQVTFFTIVWSIVALIGMFGLYRFNRGRSLLTFITSKKYLLLFILAALFGMRQYHLMGFLLTTIAIVLICLDYKPYIEKCRRLKRVQEQNQ